MEIEKHSPVFFVPLPAGERQCCKAPKGELPAGRKACNVLRLLSADWYLPTFLSLTIFTEILRLRLRMTRKAGREACNALCLLPADWHLLPVVSCATGTKILRLRLRMTMKAERQST